MNAPAKMAEILGALMVERVHPLLLEIIIPFSLRVALLEGSRAQGKRPGLCANIPLGDQLTHGTSATM
jgi:hypothetical protein